MILSSILYVSFVVVFPVLASQCESDSEDFYDENGRVIAIVPVKRFSDYAAAVSEGINNNNDFSNEWVSDWFPKFLEDEDSEEELDAEVEDERQQILDEHRAIFNACEWDILQSTRYFLKDRGYRQWFRRYRQLVVKKNKLPSLAALALGKLMMQEPAYEYTGSSLLEYIRKKLCPNWCDLYGAEHMNVESSICRALSPYYLDKFNTIVETTQPQVPTAPLYTALRKYAEHMMCDPDNSWDDVECTHSYIYEFSRRQLKKYALWHLEERAVPMPLREVNLQLLQKARALFNTVSYGWMKNRHDLLYLLQKWGFKGWSSKSKSSNNKQHIWIKFPFQVRVKEKGEVTVAFIKEDPLVHEKLHGSIRKNTIFNRNSLSEALKVCSDGQSVVLVPAFIQEQEYKDMWSLEDHSKRDDFMDHAHHLLEQSYMNFNYAECRILKLMEEISKERPPEKKG